MPSYFEIADELANTPVDRTPKKRYDGPGGLAWVIPAGATLHVNGAVIRFPSRTKIVFKERVERFRVFDEDGIEITKKGK